MITKPRPIRFLLASILLLAMLGPLGGCNSEKQQAAAPGDAGSGRIAYREEPAADTPEAQQPLLDNPKIGRVEPEQASRTQEGGTPSGSGRKTIRRMGSTSKAASHPSLKKIEPQPTPQANDPNESTDDIVRSLVKNMESSPKEAPSPGATASPRPNPTALQPMMAPLEMSAPPKDAGSPPVFYRTEEPRATASESGSEPLEAVAPDTASDVAPAAPTPEKDYTTVKVFYGTDREAITGNPIFSALSKISWATLTAAAGGITVLFLLILCFARRSRLVRLATALSLLATIGLGVCMYQIPRNTKPDEADLSLAYGNGRGELQMGVCEVSIPKDHKVGELESPSILSFEFNENPEKHIVLLGVERQEPETFFEQVSRRIDDSGSKEAFVFVHGYNVTFEDAARRTAQLAHDLEFDGAPIFYSWPSQGGLLQYTVDETNVVWTVPHLKEFLLGVAQKTNARRVHLIAHSMGNRALTSALWQVSTELKEGQLPPFHEVLLTAPDIDADVFCRDIAPAIVKTAERVTLYASSRDNALVASKAVHGYPRAGESGDDLVVVPGIDTIDVSSVDTSLLGHGYYADSDSVIVDMAQLLHERKPPTLRSRLRTVVLDRLNLNYWIFMAEKIGRRPGDTTQ